MTREIPENDPVKGIGLLRDIVLVLTTRADKEFYSSHRLSYRYGTQYACAYPPHASRLPYTARDCQTNGSLLLYEGVHRLTGTPTGVRVP